MEVIIVLFVFGMVAFGICLLIYSSHDHWSPMSGATLDENASITGINTTRYSKDKFQTTVTFSDGFKYTAFDTKKELTGINRNIISTTYRKTISVTPGMKAEIEQRALSKHNSLIEKQKKKQKK